MKSFFKNRAVGFYLLLVAAAFGIASIIFYLSWAAGNHSMNLVTTVGLSAGLAINALLLFLDNDYLVILLTALYSAALFQLLVDSAGSFADAYQGIVMFGDPTQVGTILTISALIAVSIAATIAAAFIKRKAT